MRIRRNILPVMRPLGGLEELNSLKEVIESGWWGKGSKVKEFEQKFAKLVGAKYAIAVTSNTAGQDLVLKAKGIMEGDIISPTISFLTTGIVPLWNNCNSLLCDVEAKTCNLDPVDLKKHITPNTKAVIAVNYAGIPADIDPIREYFDGLIIEDCALSCYTPGAGSKGDVAIWSFQAVKTMSCGDGGMITTNDKRLHDKLRPMINFGIPLSTYSRSTNILENSKMKLAPGYVWDYEVNSIGFKAYMNDIQACICLEQLKKLNKYLERRRNIQRRYNKELSKYITIPEWTETAQFYAARVDNNHRNSLMSYLASKRIHTTVHFKPLHLHPILKQNRVFPVADSEWQKLISFPCHPGMSDEDIDYVIYWIKEYFDKQEKF